MAETFTIWRKEKEKFIVDLLTMTRIVLSNDPLVLWKQVSQVEAWYGYACLLTAEADAWLDEETYQTLKTIRDPLVKTSAYEKEAEVNKIVKDCREFRDKIRGLAEAIKQKVMLGQSGLKAFGNLPKQAGEVN